MIFIRNNNCILGIIDWITRTRLNVYHTRQWTRHNIVLRQGIGLKTRIGLDFKGKDDVVLSEEIISLTFSLKLELRSERPTFVRKSSVTKSGRWRGSWRPGAEDTTKEWKIKGRSRALPCYISGIKSNKEARDAKERAPTANVFEINYWRQRRPGMDWISR